MSDKLKNPKLGKYAAGKETFITEGIHSKFQLNTLFRAPSSKFWAFLGLFYGQVNLGGFEDLWSNFGGFQLCEPWHAF